MAHYPITTSMQFIIDTHQKITEEEQEAIREQIEWKTSRYIKDEAYSSDFGHDITFGYHTDPSSTNFQYLWITVELSVYERRDTMTLADIRELLYNKACTLVMSVLNPMRGQS